MGRPFPFLPGRKRDRAQPLKPTKGFRRRPTFVATRKTVTLISQNSFQIQQLHERGIQNHSRCRFFRNSSFYLQLCWTGWSPPAPAGKRPDRYEFSFESDIRASRTRLAEPLESCRKAQKNSSSFGQRLGVDTVKKNVGASRKEDVLIRADSQTVEQGDKEGRDCDT